MANTVFEARLELPRWVTREEAKRAATALIDKFSANFQIGCEWEGYTCHLFGSKMGATAAGTGTISDNEIIVTAEITEALPFTRGKAESKLADALHQLEEIEGPKFIRENFPEPTPIASTFQANDIPLSKGESWDRLEPAVFQAEPYGSQIDTTERSEPEASDAEPEPEPRRPIWDPEPEPVRTSFIPPHVPDSEEYPFEDQELKAPRARQREDRFNWVPAVVGAVIVIAVLSIATKYIFLPAIDDWKLDRAVGRVQVKTLKQYPRAHSNRAKLASDIREVIAAQNLRSKMNDSFVVNAAVIEDGNGLYVIELAVAVPARKLYGIGWARVEGDGATFDQLVSAAWREALADAQDRAKRAKT